jgi:hypothetical protein
MNLIKTKLPRAIDSGASIVVTQCQNCNNSKLKSIIFLGYLPPVNKLVKIGSVPSEQPSYPANLLYCNKCHLVQLGLIVDPKILFPSEYPYTSGTTKVLRDNFAELYQEASSLLSLQADDLIVDIGSNDGTLLSNFKKNHRILGVTPEAIGKIAIKNGIPTVLDYFTKKVSDDIKKQHGKAKVVTAANVFAHMEQIHTVIDAITGLLSPDGVFISESHYLLPLIKQVQYDTIYHEHMRYYSLSSLIALLKTHDLEVFHAKEIPSHGGSFRAYAAKKGSREILPSVKSLLEKEKKFVTNTEAFDEFRSKTALSKTALHSLLLPLKKRKKKIYGISAPSRASTLINYTGLDQDIMDCVLEVKGSHKIGKYIPGTLIPILDESKLFNDQPDYALLLSWHIADELMPKLKTKGFKGDFIIPLPMPVIVKNKQIKV